MSTSASQISYEYLASKCERAHRTEQRPSEPEPAEFLLPGEEPEIRQNTFASQARTFLESLSARRTPAKPATVSTWRSLIDVHILPRIGQESLASFDNGKMKTFIDFLCDEGEVSPGQVRDIVLVVKNIVASAVDPNGNFLYPRQWNNSFLDLPQVKASNAPAATRESIEEAVKILPQNYSMLVALGAASGSRLGELLALRIDDDGENSYWDRANSLLLIRRSVWRGVLQTPKTASAVRTIDLCVAANEAVASWAGNRTKGFLFESRNGSPLSATTVYRFGLSKTKIPGAHSLRRFRATQLADAEVPMPLIKMWLGHSKDDISEQYIRPSEMASRKQWAEKVGLGFTL